jgi:hypothetical protein
MGILFIFALATTMAIFSTLGYLKGTKWAVISLLIMFVTFVAVEKFPDQIISTLNGLFLGVMLVLQGGLSDIASGDLDAAAKKLENIDKPFQGENEKWALLLVIGTAVLATLVLALIIKKGKPSIAGGILGLLDGYLVAAASFPLLFNIKPSLLPVPPIRPFEAAKAGHGAPGGATSAAGNLLANLAQPENVQILAIVIAAGLALLLFLTVRRGNKRSGRSSGRPAGGGAPGSGGS